MLKFIRRLRQNALNANNSRKYIRYAVGEIILVVAGILIALQLNNWNEAKKNQQVEVALLEQLEKDLTSSLGDVTFNIGLIDQGIQSAELLLDYMETDLPYEDSLAYHFAAAFPWTRLVISLGAYETIKSRGIEIISNAAIRNEMVQLFETRLFFQRELENITQDYAEHLRRSESATFFKSSYKKSGLEGNYFLGKSVPKNYSALKNNAEFRYHLESFSSLLMTLQRQGNIPSKHRIEELVGAIQEELEGK